jgi:exopolysaccharide biosynthesis polyprenyl glycosylphosphotransferase
LGNFDFSRLMLIYTWILAIILLTLVRILLYLVRRILLKKGIGVRRVLILGRNKAADLLAEFFKKNKGYGYRLVKVLDVNHEPNLKELALIINRNRVSDIIQVKEFASQEKNVNLIKMAHERQIVFREVPNLYELRKGIYETGTLGDVPILEFRSTPLEGWGRIAKRFIDVVVSAILLIILSPFFLVIAIIIRLDSPGPIFFRQERVGRRKNFGIFKFRSMYKDAEERKKELWRRNERKGGPLFKIKNDPRITRVGEIIRLTRIDELPQLINVLKGEMSLVGPRPHLPSEVRNYKKHQRKVLIIKPGITGMAQISGASELAFEDEVGLDAFYVDHWSLFLDLIIIIKTLGVVARREGAA